MSLYVASDYGTDVIDRKGNWVLLKTKKGHFNTDVPFYMIGEQRSLIYDEDVDYFIKTYKGKWYIENYEDALKQFKKIKVRN